jgi:hypothetical protein
MRNIEAEIVDLKEMIKGYENDFKQATREDRNILGPMIIAKEGMIIAKEGRLHDLSEELKALRNQQQQGNEQRTRPFILWFFQNPSSPEMPCCVSTFVFMFSNVCLQYLQIDPYQLNQLFPHFMIMQSLHLPRHMSYIHLQVNCNVI